MRDLLVLVPDKNTEYLIGGAISRHISLGIRPIDCRIIVESGRDGGVRSRGAQVLKIERQRFAHAAMVLDYEGCGATVSPEALEAELDQELRPDWADDAKAIVIAPEVDAWLWGADSHLRDVLGWTSATPVRQWLVSRGFKFSETGKPVRPKEAFDVVCQHVGLPRSSRHYEAIAARLSLTRCHDPAFQRLREAIKLWFTA
jgi:hypothetical protein